MAVGQVMAIYSARVYRKHADEMEKSFYVPFADSMRMSREAQSRLSGTGPLSDHPDREIFPLADHTPPRRPSVPTGRHARPPRDGAAADD